jgi:DNA polymerase-3 subunit epsilon
MPGFAVIDLETTGFAYNHTDRICEIGVVLLDPHGNREGVKSREVV